RRALAGEVDAAHSGIFGGIAAPGAIAGQLIANVIFMNYPLGALFPNPPSSSVPRFIHFSTVTLVLFCAVTQAAVITVNTANNVNPGPNETNFVAALKGLHDGDTILFNIPGSGPFYISTPTNGYPFLTNNNVVIDGYSQPGSAPNTNSILQP